MQLKVANTQRKMEMLVVREHSNFRDPTPVTKSKD